jgi:hypothetical protein
MTAIYGLHVPISTINARYEARDRIRPPLVVLRQVARLLDVLPDVSDGQEQM